MINFPFVHTATLCGSTGFSATTGVDFRNPFYSSGQGLASIQKSFAISHLYAISVWILFTVLPGINVSQTTTVLYDCEAWGVEDKNGTDAAMRMTRFSICAVCIRLCFVGDKETNKSKNTELRPCYFSFWFRSFLNHETVYCVNHLCVYFSYSSCLFHPSGHIDEEKWPSKLRIPNLSIHQCSQFLPQYGGSAFSNSLLLVWDRILLGYARKERHFLCFICLYYKIHFWLWLTNASLIRSKHVCVRYRYKLDQILLFLG